MSVNNLNSTPYKMMAFMVPLSVWFWKAWYLPTRKQMKDHYPLGHACPLWQCYCGGAVWTISSRHIDPVDTVIHAADT